MNFPASAQYLDVSEEDQSRSIASMEVGTYLLSMCATIEDVKHAPLRGGC